MLDSTWCRRLQHLIQLGASLLEKCRGATVMNQSITLPPPAGLLPFSDPDFLSQRFNPGVWQDRRQLNTRSCVVISGNYERKEPVLGGYTRRTSTYTTYASPSGPVAPRDIW